MTYVPHFRLSLLGEISGGKEQFSCSLSLIPNGSLFGAVMAAGSPLVAFEEYLTDNYDPDFGDLVDDCVNFWARPATGVCNLAVLKRVKLAPIRPDGKYAAAPMEAAVDQEGLGSEDLTHVAPWQVSRKITLETDADLGRVKGGFYLPLPVMADHTWEPEENLWLEAWVAQVKGSCATFINDIENEPGIDFGGWQVVVASQGRFNANGTQRVAPGNHDVKRINVGRRPDIQRRRANKVSETRGPDTTLE